MTSAQEAECLTLRDSREARQRAVDELRERWERLNAATMSVPHDEYALADEAARNAGSAYSAHSLGIQTVDEIEERFRTMSPGNADIASSAAICAHVLTLCRCLLESRRLEA